MQLRSAAPVHLDAMGFIRTTVSGDLEARQEEPPDGGRTEGGFRPSSRATSIDRTPPISKVARFPSHLFNEGPFLSHGGEAASSASGAESITLPGGAGAADGHMANTPALLEPQRLRGFTHRPVSCQVSSSNGDLPRTWRSNSVSPDERDFIPSSSAIRTPRHVRLDLQP